MYRIFFLIPFLFACSHEKTVSDRQQKSSAQGIEITHGPILGHLTDSSIRIWARTSKPGSFSIQYQELEDETPPNWLDHSGSLPGATTLLENDNAGWATIRDLNPNTRYVYRVVTESENESLGGSFKTIPNAANYRNAEHNPKGLFNFQFEYGSCANQDPAHGIGYSLPTYTTLLDEVKGDVSFAVMNGDWLYEEQREYSLEEWQKQQGISEEQIPQDLIHAPTMVGVWENYKTYLSRGKNLAEWHRNVPSYFTFDDHELVNDIWGAGSAGRRDRRAVFRDIGTAAWYDYLGWANPVDFTQDIYFGKGQFEASSNVMYDANADFTALDLEQMSNLHVHWGTTTAGVNEIVYDVDEEGDPNSRVYDIVEIIDKNRIRISPDASADGSASYSIGRRSYAKFSISNCDFFLLDTRSHRQYHDTEYRDKPGLTILGDEQREWLKKAMQNSDADFFFLFSTVPFMIPHVGAGGFEAAENKDEAWTVFLDEREKLIHFWEDLDKPVFVLTGDLHNSFAIKITDHIWEFCSGPHNSVNHRLSDEGYRPKSGIYQFDKRQMDIRWSSFILDDIPRTERLHPFYCVVQINNALNNPLKLGEERWVAYEHPQVIFKYFDGRTGDLRYAETVSTKR